MIDDDDPISVVSFQITVDFSSVSSIIRAFLKSSRRRYVERRFCSRRNERISGKWLHMPHGAMAF